MPDFKHCNYLLVTNAECSALALIEPQAIASILPPPLTTEISAIALGDNDQLAGNQPTLAMDFCNNGIVCYA